MEDQQSGLFSFNLDEYAQSTLVSIAQWNRFMAWVGIIISAIFIIALPVGGSYLFSTFTRPRYAQSAAALASNGSLVIFFYVIIAAVYMVPCFFKLSFSNKMLRAVAGSDKESLSKSLSQLKTYSVYWGIVTIIGIFFYLMMIIGIIIAVSTAAGIRSTNHQPLF